MEKISCTTCQTPVTHAHGSAYCDGCGVSILSDGTPSSEHPVFAPSAPAPASTEFDSRLVINSLSDLD